MDIDKDFLRNIAPITIQFKKITLNIGNKLNMELCVKTLLNVADMGSLRDKYEGEAFKNNFFIRTSAEMALEKILGIKVIDWDLKKTDKKYKAEFIVNGMKLEIFASAYGHYPLITDLEADYAIIILYREPRDVLVAGCMSYDKVKNGPLKNGNQGLKNGKALGYFDDFYELNPFRDAEELIQAIKLK